jgi:uncharacterized protein involved in exopolysaccharide biosynthesis
LLAAAHFGTGLRLPDWGTQTMLRFLETFYRHRVLLLTPVVIVLVLAVGWVLIQPRGYDSTVRLWTERSSLVSNPNDDLYLTPAQVQAGVLNELLATKYFCVKAGRRGPLHDYLQQVAQRPPNLLTRIEAKVGLAARPGALSESQLDERMFSVLSTSTAVVPSGPEVVTITFHGSNPFVTAKVAQAIAEQFLEEQQTTQRIQQEASITFYTSQLKTAQADAAAAEKAVIDYQVAHPEQRAPSSIPDARMAQLLRDEDAAHQRVSGIQRSLDQTNINQAALNLTGINGLRVLDQAEVPTRATSLRKPAIIAGGIGAGLGLLIIVIGVLVLTLADGTVRRPEEVQEVLDLRQVGTVPKLS